MALKKLIKTIEDLYKNLLKDGYKLNEIEDMDIFYFLYLMGEDETKLTPIESLNW